MIYIIGLLCALLVLFIIVRTYRSSRTTIVQKHSYCCDECVKKEQCPHQEA